MNYILGTFPLSNNTITPVTMTINSIECETTAKSEGYTAKVTIEAEVSSPAFSGNVYTIRVDSSTDRVLPDAKTFAKLIEDDLKDFMSDMKQYFK